MRRVSILLPVIAVLLVTPLAVSAASTNLSVSSVTVSPSGPSPGESVTLTPRVVNLDSSQSAFDVEDIMVRTAGNEGDFEELDRVSNLGSLSPGSSLEASLTVEFQSSGLQNLKVIVYGHPAGSPAQTTRLEHPVSFTVRDRDPQIDIRANDSVEGLNTDGTIQIANGLGSELSNIEVRANGTGVEMIDRRGIIASLSPGETASIPIRFRSESAGLNELNATVRYTVDDSTRRTSKQSTTIQTNRLGEGAKLSATEVGGGPERGLKVEILNPHDRPIRNVVVSATSDNATFDSSIVSSVAAGESRRVRLNATVEQSPATARITANYTIDGLDRTANSTTEMGSTAGNLTLTGLDVTRESDGLHISGSASNSGVSPVDSVIVSVQNTAKVDPTFPNKEYFVGTIPSSDFVSFDVYARTTGNVSSIPLTVDYTIDGNRLERQYLVELGSQDSGSEQASAGGGLQSNVAVGLGAFMTLGIGAIMVFGWRKSRDDS